MKIYDKDSPIKGPVDHNWMKKNPSTVVPSENYSLMELQVSDNFRLLPNKEVRDVGEAIVEDVEAIQMNLKKDLLYGLLRGDSSERLLHDLKSNYSKETVLSNQGMIRKVLAERGVFGRVYIDTKMFPRCQHNEGQEVVKKYGSKAVFAISKKKCRDCSHNDSDSGMCTVYGKQLVTKVSYNNDVLSHYQPYLIREKGVDPAKFVKSGKTYKEAIKLSFCHVEKEQKHVAIDVGADSRPQKREVSESFVNSAESVLHNKMGLKILAGNSDLNDYRTTESFQHFADEKGLFGHLYVDLDMFGGDCKKAKKFLDRVGNNAPIVISKPCSHYNGKTRKCSVLKRIMVSKLDITKNWVRKLAVVQAIKNNQVSKIQANKILSLLVNKDMDDTRSVISKMNLLPEMGSQLIPTTKVVSDINEFDLSNNVLDDFNLDEDSHPKISATHQVLRDEIQHYTVAKMNEGYYGSDLSELLRFKFGNDSLSKASDIIGSLQGEEGLMGIYYIDPSIYSSCDEGAKTLRGRGAKYLLAMDQCSFCTANSEGHCQKYSKRVVDEIPYIDRESQQKEILSRTSSQSLEPADVISYQSILDQFNLQTGLEDIDLDEGLKSKPNLEIKSGGMILDFE